MVIFNAHFNCIVQKPAWSRPVSLEQHVPHPVRMVYTIGVHESIENVDVWELCKIANICG